MDGLQSRRGMKWAKVGALISGSSVPWIVERKSIALDAHQSPMPF